MFSACSYVYADKFTACVQNAGLPTRAVLRWGRGGGTAPPPQMLATPQIFWFQQQKYAFLKSGLFFTVAKSTLVSVRA